MSITMTNPATALHHYAGHNSVVIALEHGTPPEAIAHVADIDPAEVLDLAGISDQRALLGLDDLHLEATTDEGATILRDAG